MKKITKPIGTEYTLVLDAWWNLFEAGEPCDLNAQSDYDANFRDTAAALAKELGIKITIISGSYDGLVMRQQSNNGDEQKLWETICHCTVVHAD